MTLEPAERFALGDLVARYALYVDHRDIPALTGLFADDAVLVLPEAPNQLDPVRTFTGREAISTAFSALHGIPLTFHAIVGQVFDAGAEPGTATGHIACVAHHVTEREAGDARDLVWHVRYADTYRRDGGAWRIARREQSIDTIETRPVRRWRGGG